MSKADFEQFEIGTVFNPCVVEGQPHRVADQIRLDYPSRLEAMALDPGQIADNNNLVYRAGQIDITVPLFKEVTVTANGSGEAKLTETTPRQTLVRHAAALMVQALDIKDGLTINVKDEVNLRHCGLGSSSSLIAGVASAINEMYGKPVKPLHLVRYLAQNHGEEIDGDDKHLIPVQCIGGSAVCGNFPGGMIVLAGEATPIAQMEVSNEYSVVIGVPRDFDHPDSQQLMQAEIDNMEGFRQTSNQYGKEIAYRLVHEVMPGMTEGNLKPAGDLVFDYRWNMGSIKNCSFVFPRMLDIAEDLRSFHAEGTCDMLALSSVGPGFFAVTKDPEAARERFEANNMATYTTTVHNGTYVLKTEAEQS
ncbi:MAG TPA: hypothetical protein VFT53_03045 [Candidatus Saccharimonadales bacterium]|nr:hypothetical protein [Candidatus Saccharimonadales bacterium]